MLTSAKLPPQFDEKMSSNCRSILTMSIPVYLGMCIWALGNINLLDRNNSSFADSLSSSLQLTQTKW